ncbi:MAG: hypothetical protein C0608_00020 [Deltaproteobacteria bacterium]|nr:MAG: hypothetical protein C0608_00020 [Deltaproteobacteria bacterium]
MSLNELLKLPISDLLELARKRFGIEYPKSAARGDIVKELAKLLTTDAATAIVQKNPESMLRDELIEELRDIHKFDPPTKWRKDELIEKVHLLRAELA